MVAWVVDPDELVVAVLFLDNRYMVALVVDLDELVVVDAFWGNPYMVVALDALAELVVEVIFFWGNRCRVVLLVVVQVKLVEGVVCIWTTCIPLASQEVPGVGVILL